MSLKKYAIVILFASVLLTALMPITTGWIAWAFNAAAFAMPGILAGAFVRKNHRRGIMDYKWPSLIFLAVVSLAWLGQARL